MMKISYAILAVLVIGNLILKKRRHYNLCKCLYSRHCRMQQRNSNCVEWTYRFMVLLLCKLSTTVLSEQPRCHSSCYIFGMVCGTFISISNFARIKVANFFADDEFNWSTQFCGCLYHSRFCCSWSLYL